MTLRCERLTVVPTIGPRSAALDAPQATGGVAPAAGAAPEGCDVRRMCRSEDLPAAPVAGGPTVAAETAAGVSGALRSFSVMVTREH
jgi:hypothetical protein